MPGEDYKKDCSVKRETAPEKLCLDYKASVPFPAVFNVVVLATGSCWNVD